MEMQHDIPMDEPLCEADLLEEMVMALVDHPDQVRVELSHRAESIDLMIHTDPRDFGKVIGKSGRTVDAIRTLMGVIASKSGKRASVRMAADEVQRPVSHPHVRRR